LIFLETEGWSILDEKSKDAFLRFLSDLELHGITIIRRGMSNLVEQLEQAVSNASIIANAITSWENHWGYRNLVNLNPEGVSQRLKNTLSKAECMTPEIYQSYILQRTYAREAHKFCSSVADGIITLSCLGPAPVWEEYESGSSLIARPTGDPIFNFASSIVGAPCVTIPMLSVGKLPVGIQIVGQREKDANTTSLARWIHQNISPISIE
jgi:Asp-tRNA(Asn)/Glu-tRNA(Gln) amidotransferase A subunit family amidase